FRDGSDPNSKVLRVAYQGAAVDTNGQSYVTFKDLAVRGSDDGIIIHDGEGITVDADSISVNRLAVYVYGAASNTMIHVNRITFVPLSQLGLAGCFGISDGQHPQAAYPDAYAAAVKSRVYRGYKYWVGSSDSIQGGIIGALGAAGHTEISYNHVHDIPGPIWMTINDVHIHHNRVARAHNSCVGFDAGSGGGLLMHDNLIIDCNQAIRLVGPEKQPPVRGAYIYRNRFWNRPYHYGNIFYVRPSGPITGHIPHEFFVYHNSYSGGFEQLQ